MRNTGLLNILRFVVIAAGSVGKSISQSWVLFLYFRKTQESRRFILVLHQISVRLGYVLASSQDMGPPIVPKTRPRQILHGLSKTKTDFEKH